MTLLSPAISAAARGAVTGAAAAAGTAAAIAAGAGAGDGDGAAAAAAAAIATAASMMLEAALFSAVLGVLLILPAWLPMLAPRVVYIDRRGG